MKKNDFQVGDQVKVINQVGDFACLNGQEGEIVGPYGARGVSLLSGHRCIAFGFAVEVGGRKYSIGPKYLRKNDPPGSDTGELRILQLFVQPPVVSPVETVEGLAL